MMKRDSGEQKAGFYGTTTLIKERSFPYISCLHEELTTRGVGAFSLWINPQVS